MTRRPTRQQTSVVASVDAAPLTTALDKSRGSENTRHAEQARPLRSRRAAGKPGGGAISPPLLPPSEARRPGKRRPGKSRRAMRPASIAATQKGRNERRRLAPTPCADASTRQDDKKESFFPPCRRRQAEGTGGRDAAEPSPSPPVREKHVRAATAAQEPARPAANNEPRRESGYAELRVAGKLWLKSESLYPEACAAMRLAAISWRHT